MSRKRGYRDNGPVIGLKEEDGMHQFQLENGKWYTYNTSTPNRYRTEYPNLDMRIYNLVRNRPLFNKEDIYSKLLRDGMSRYVLDKKYVSEKVDTSKLRLLRDVKIDCGYMPEPVCQAFRRGSRAITYAGVRYEFDRGETGILMLLTLSCSGIVRIVPGGVGRPILESFTGYKVRHSLTRAKLAASSDDYEESLLEIFKIQCENIVLKKLKKERKYAELLANVGSVSPNMTILNFRPTIINVRY